MIYDYKKNRENKKIIKVQDLGVGCDVTVFHDSTIPRLHDSPPIYRKDLSSTLSAPDPTSAPPLPSPLPLPTFTLPDPILPSWPDPLALAPALAPAPVLSRAAFSRRWMAASAPTPPKTRPTPSHCRPLSRWPNQRTERSMVSILRVTVTVTRMSDEKCASV